MLEEWGVVVEDPAGTFESIRARMKPRFKVGLQGKILFREFAHWAIMQQLELREADEDYEEDEAEGEAH